MSSTIKNVFITGGSRGIGAAIVKRFALSKGFNIVFTYKNNETLANALVNKLSPESSSKILAIHMDLLSKDSIEEATKKAIAYLGEIHIVVHNAAFCDDVPFFFMEQTNWHQVIDASLNSFFYINKLCLPNMIENKWGRIVVLSSVSGEAGNRGQVNYSAAKGALIAASKALSKEVARKNVLVNIVSPGIIDTDMTKNIPLGNIKQLIPVGRFGRPDEVANAVYFLSSDDASFISGAILQVNGGMYT